MREIVPALTPELEEFYGARDQVAHAAAFPVDSFEDLVRQIAQLAHLNGDNQLFFRGQGIDFHNKGGSSTLYPAIYRGDYLPREEVRERFRQLDIFGIRLKEAFETSRLAGTRDIRMRSALQWSLLQHYEVVATPLLDITHSLTVACSFAEHFASGPYGYVYVFGLPYVTNRISIDSEHEILNVRLLSICPPDALRPYFQEGYLVGNWDIFDNYEKKSELDFNRRLIAKFKFNISHSFWGSDFGRVPEDLLYPSNDQVKVLCDRIREDVEAHLAPHALGDFLQVWKRIERALVQPMRNEFERAVTTREAISLWAEYEAITPELSEQLEYLRKWRNRLVHETEAVSTSQVERLVAIAQAVLSELEGRNFS